MVLSLALLLEAIESQRAKLLRCPPSLSPLCLPKTQPLPSRKLFVPGPSLPCAVLEAGDRLGKLAHMEEHGRSSEMDTHILQPAPL